ncbi:hypothetical protein HID58_056325, partial [Brassica napus]
MEIDSVAAGGALKPNGDRFRRDEEPHFLIDVKKKTLLRQGANLVLELGPCKDCERYQYKSFELNIVWSYGTAQGSVYSANSFLVVTVSQFTTLFQTTAYSGRITYINGGDFAVSEVVQVVVIILCLHAATKISHRAQAIASVARLLLVEFTWKPPQIHPSPFRI